MKAYLQVRGIFPNSQKLRVDDMGYSQASQVLFTNGRYTESDLLDSNHWQPVVLNKNAGN